MAKNTATTYLGTMNVSVRRAATQAAFALGCDADIALDYGRARGMGWRAADARRFALEGADRRQAQAWEGRR